MEATDTGRFEAEILPFLPERIRTALTGKVESDVEEIRLRAGKPLIVQDSNGEWFYNWDGKVRPEDINSSKQRNKGCDEPRISGDIACELRRSKGLAGCIIIEPSDILQALELLTSNSVYAFQEEIRNGYITIKGGHRVGITGKVISEGLNVKAVKDIMSLNIRIAKEVIGCAEKILPYIAKGKNDIYNTLIVSPPQCGKTTMLRDLTRLLSNGCSGTADFNGVKVCIIDERSEIAACFRGVPQNDVGIRTDVLDSCPKTAGMIMGLRALSPAVIVTDEIGNEGDKDAVTRVLNAGVKILTTAHGYNVSELKARREVMEMIEDKVFERYVVLSSREGPGTIEEIIEGEGFTNIYDGTKEPSPMCQRTVPVSQKEASSC